MISVVQMLIVVRSAFRFSFIVQCCVLTHAFAFNLSNLFQLIY